jgi:hypothetical protein
VAVGPVRRQLGKAAVAAAAARAAAGEVKLEQQLQEELLGVGGLGGKRQGWGVEEGGEGLEEACRRYHRLQKRHKVNGELRREAAVLVRKVEMFQQHLVQAKVAADGKKAVIKGGHKRIGSGRERGHGKQLHSPVP